jgi:LuxR family maltose regulon positive regulatory protein
LDESRAQAIVITGPAGYGKTTLATEWLQGRENVFWYRATNASADVAAFSAGIADLISSLLPGAGERLRQRLRVADTPERAARPLAELLAEDLAEWPESALLVIDDYHLVANSAPVEDFFDWLLTLAPQLRVLVTSRRRPRWASARRILYGEITEFGRDQLAMNAEEAGRVLGDDRSSESVRALVTQAEGWPALIGLAALTASREIPGERVSEALYRYFAEEVVRREAPEVERFMLLASVPATVDARIAREVLGVEDPEPTLAGLVEEGLLHPAGEQFRFHPLLRSFLRQRLETEEPDFYRRLAHGAVEDARNTERWEDAFEIAVEMDSLDLAGQVLEQATAELLAAGRIEILERWLDECGPAAVQQAGAVLARVEILTRHGRLKEAAGIAGHLCNELCPDEARRSRAEYLAGRAYHLMSKESMALEYHTRARLSAANPQDLSNALWGAYLAAVELGLPEAPDYLNELEALALPDLGFRLRVATGRMASAASGGSLRGISDVFEPLLPVVGHVNDPMVETSFLTRAAEIEVLRGRYAAAHSFSSQALDLAEKLHLAFAEPLCLIPLIAAEIGLRRFASARDKLFLLSNHSLSSEDPYLQLSTQILKLKLRASDPRSSREHGYYDVDETVHSASRGEHFALLALEAATRGDYENVDALARRATETSSAVEARFYSSFAQAIVARKCGQNLEAVKRTVAALVRETDENEMLDAVVLACRADPELPKMLLEFPDARRIVGQTLLSSGDRSLAERAGILDRTGVNSHPGTVLTPREIEVLELLTRGLSNAAIASELVISVSTAKVHVHHVLAKLGVKTRLQAVLKAGELESAAARQRLSPRRE